MGTEQRIPTARAGQGNAEGDADRRLVMRNNAKGVAVYTPDGNKLGRIECVMAEQATGEIAYAIVSFGSASSIGFETDRHRVPWSLLAHNPRFDGYELRITGGGASQRT